MRRRMILPSLIVLGFVLGVTPAIWAQSFTFTTIDVPGSTFTIAVGIDSFGQIVGVYGDGFRVHGFLLDNAGNFNTIDFPNSTFTQLRRINDAGQLLGNYRVDLSRKHGFLLNPPYGLGDYATIDVPFPGALDNSANGLNDLGQIAGQYIDANGNHSFFADSPYDPTNFTSFDVPLPGALGNGAGGINNAGQILGGFFANGSNHGYLANPPYGPTDFTSFDFPGAISICPVRLNNNGDIVGDYLDAGSQIHGFLITGGVSETIDFPGASLQSLSDPCNSDTGAFGINDSGQIVGGYVDAIGTFHGYLATPVP